MKSYTQHLKSTREFGEKTNILKKPVLRSSAIFPVLQNDFYSSSIHFLGYWLLKRNIREVSLVITLRDSSGSILLRKIDTIDSAKAFTIELSKLLTEVKFLEKNFVGSIETEFNTTRDMVFPYPALVLEFYNESFNTCVHTLGRIYNDLEDLNENNEFHVPETGFDIYETDDLHSFLSFVNGPIKNHDGFIKYTITNSDSQKSNGSFHIGEINPFETKFIHLSEYIPKLSEILDGESGSISLSHNFEGFYPRFLVGNIQNSFPSISFTHSYYDCSSQNSESDYWNRSNENHYDSSVYIPIFNKNDQFTNLILYPNLSPSDFTLQIDIHRKNGSEITNFPEYVHIVQDEKKLTKIDLGNIISNIEPNNNDVFCAHVITDFKNKKIPSRIKFGLDIGIKNSKSKLPCNICFNTKMGNPYLENKPGSFHWTPIFKNRFPVLTIGNFSTLKNYTRNANMELTFYRAEDSTSKTEKFTLNANCERRITIDDFNLDDFLKTEGWMTIKSDNPYIQGFYFHLNSSGSVSGDHFF